MLDLTTAIMAWTGGIFALLAIGALGALAWQGWDMPDNEHLPPHLPSNWEGR